MRAVIQRVSSASVTIDGVVKSSIGPGLLVLLGVGHQDDGTDIDWLVKKTAGHQTAIPLYEQFCGALSQAIGRPVGTGEFGADMKVALVNDGPVTICLDSRNKE